MSTDDSKFRFNAADFPVLREFLRGYLHEDWHDEYRSPREAVEQFHREAGPKQASELAREWHRLIEVSREEMHATIAMLNTLGGAWNPSSPEELDEVGGALAKCMSQTGPK
jgi:hypothetical protein